MDIVRMTEQHLDALAQLEQQCFSQPWSRQALATELQNPNAIFLVAEQAGEVLGYMGMHQVLDEGYIANIAVSPDYRRMGTATKLLDAMLEYACSHKMGFLTLEVRASNHPAIVFYQKHGFGEVGRRKGYYANPTEDALLMTKFLA